MYTTMTNIFFVGFSNGTESVPETKTKESTVLGGSNGTEDVTNSNGGQSFQIKPTKERAKKKTSGCIVL